MRINRLHPTPTILSGHRQFVFTNIKPVQPSFITSRGQQLLHTRPPLLRAKPPQSKAKAPLAMTTTATTLKGQPLDRTVLDGLLRRRMFYTPSFEVSTTENLCCRHWC